MGTFNHFNNDIINEAEHVFSQKFGQSKELIPEDIIEVTIEKGQKLYVL